MIKKLSIALLVLCSVCLAGCNVKDVNDFFTRKYEFDNYEGYKAFYDNFCEYNVHRFIMPKETEQIEFNYVFYATTWEKDKDKDEFTLSYLMADACAEVKNLSGDTFTIEAYNVCNWYDTEIDDTSEIRYVVEYNKYRDLNDINFYIGYGQIARVCEVTNEFVNSDGFTTLMDNILEAYKGGE